METAGPRSAAALFRSCALAALLLLTASCRSRVTRPGEQAKAPPGEAMPAWERDLREALRKPVTVEFREATLAEACETLSRLASIPIRIDPAVGAGPVRINLPRCTLRAEDALRWASRFAPGRWVIRDGAVLIVPSPPLSKLVAREYDVSDLAPSAGEGSYGAADLVHSMKKASEGGWCRYVQAAVAPDTWPDAPKLGAAAGSSPSVTCADGRLAVVHNEAVQAKIGALLDELRKMRNRQVHFNVRFVAIDRGALDALKLNLKWQGAADSAASYTRLSQAQLTALIEAVVKKRKGTAIFAPRLTCFNTQQAEIQCISNYGYVRRFAPDGKEVPPPGLSLAVRPFVSSDRKWITVVTRWVYVEDEGRIEALFDSTMTLPDAGSVMLIGSSLPESAAGARASGQRQVLLALLSAEIVPDIFEEE